MFVHLEPYRNDGELKKKIQACLLQPHFIIFNGLQLQVVIAQ
jgi:hypothetical protein